MRKNVDTGALQEMPSAFEQESEAMALRTRFRGNYSAHARRNFHRSLENSSLSCITANTYTLPSWELRK